MPLIVPRDLWINQDGYNLQWNDIMQDPLNPNKAEPNRKLFFGIIIGLGSIAVILVLWLGLLLLSQFQATPPVFDGHHFTVVQSISF